jgi:L-amino acid N-acyltransferase YncA
MDYRISPCTEKHLSQILEIFNEAIVHSTALYDYAERTMDNMKDWYSAKLNGNYPVIGAFDAQDSLLGFTSYGPFRNWRAYKYTVEHSIYVSSGNRGKGIGKILLREIIKSAREQGYHVLIGGIDAENKVSIHLHVNEGFVFCGTINQAGYKFERWLDLSFYQLILPGPQYPKEDK